MSVFNALYADEYDTLYAEKDYKSECDLLERALSRHSGNPVRSLLDVGCGTGGHSIEMAQRGYRVTGVDLSRPMLDRAEKKAAVLSPELRPTWLCGDARDFNANGQFDLAIMMFAVVGYLTANEDVLAAMRNIRRHIRAGAALICDFWYGPSVLSVRPTDRIRVLATSEGRVIRAASTTLDIAAHTADVKFNLWSLKGEKLVGEVCETHRVRYYFPQEFALILGQTGFKLESLSAFPSLDTPLDDRSWNALAVARAV